MNPFDTYKFHPSGVSHLMTCLPGLSGSQTTKLNDLYERHTKAKVGLAKPLTEKMEAEMLELIAKRDAKDVLPVGALTELQKIYNSVVWRRKRQIDSWKMQKGNFQEQDAIDLVSKADKTFYPKNKKLISNKLMNGTPDILTPVKDTKCSWDMDTFDAAKLISDYEDQIKGYLWIQEETKGELVYCLVNSPKWMVLKALDSEWYKLGEPTRDDSDWVEIAAQIERNMVFDMHTKEYKDFPWYNTDDITIPAELRIKRFDVTLTDDDIKSFEMRLPTCRQWLADKYESEKHLIPKHIINKIAQAA